MLRNGFLKKWRGCYLLKNYACDANRHNNINSHYTFYTWISYFNNSRNVKIIKTVSTKNYHKNINTQVLLIQ